jgi:formamidopyrimidine-DNA glycosylase
MWGGMYCFPAGEPGGSPDYQIAKQRPSPLSEQFDQAYWANLCAESPANLSAKAFLATEQRIPGLGNGVLQDILWTARIHPKRKLADLSEEESIALYAAVRAVLHQMTSQGGRDSERDLFGRPGGYISFPSQHAASKPCPVCATPIKKEAYMGGSIYYCPSCQTL